MQGISIIPSSSSHKSFHFTRVLEALKVRERSRTSSSVRLVENPVTSAPTRNPPIFLARRPVHAHAPAPLPTRRDKENASVYRACIAKSGSRMGNWNGFISRRKTRFFSRGETADFSFDRAPVSRLDTCNARVIYRDRS